MITIEQRILDFLTELRGQSDLNKGQSFSVDVFDKKDDPKDFRYSIIQELHRNGAIDINDKGFGSGISSKGKTVSLASCYSMEGLGYKPIEMLIRINKKNFDTFYTISKQKAEDIVKCAYQKNYTCILTANDINISFSGLTGLVLYYLFLSRIAPNNQDYENFNIFLAKEGYIDKFAVINSTQFRHSIKEINERVKKETNKYLNTLIKTIGNGNRKNEYKWKPEITEM